MPLAFSLAWRESMTPSCTTSSCASVLISSITRHGSPEPFVPLVVEIQTTLMAFVSAKSSRVALLFVYRPALKPARIRASVIEISSSLPFTLRLVPVEIFLRIAPTVTSATSIIIDVARTLIIKLSGLLSTARLITKPLGATCAFAPSSALGYFRESLKVFVQLLLRVFAEKACDECAQASGGRLIAQDYMHQSRSATRLSESYFALCINIAAHAPPCYAMWRIEVCSLSLPLHTRAERSVRRPSRVASAGIVNIPYVAHPSGEVLEIAEEIEDTLDGRINLYDFLYSLHNVNSNSVRAFPT